MTPEQLDELQRLHEAATPGPWEWLTQTDPTGEVEMLPDADLYKEGNAALIVAMRNALPELIAAARMFAKVQAPPDDPTLSREEICKMNAALWASYCLARNERDAALARVAELEATLKELACDVQSFAAEAGARERDACADLLKRASVLLVERMARGDHFEQGYDVRREIIAMVSTLRAAETTVRQRGSK